MRTGRKSAVKVMTSFSCPIFVPKNLVDFFTMDVLVTQSTLVVSRTKVVEPKSFDKGKNAGYR
jgi:hypothetical protein